jgi:hypothetical protein
MTGLVRLEDTRTYFLGWYFDNGVFYDGRMKTLAAHGVSAHSAPLGTLARKSKREGAVRARDEERRDKTIAATKGCDIRKYLKTS